MFDADMGLHMLSCQSLILFAAAGWYFCHTLQKHGALLDTLLYQNEDKYEEEQWLICFFLTG